MTRTKGVAPVTFNFEPETASPLDARTVVQTKADLTNANTFLANDGNEYTYKGMIVSVTNDGLNNALYRLNNLPTTNTDNWEQLTTFTPVETLTYSSTITLQDNKIYSLNCTGNVTFTLPTVTDTTIYHQILIQFYMANAVTINLGTTNYFKKTAPTMTTAGMYNIVYEYDNLNSCWVVDAVVKGPAS